MVSAPGLKRVHPDVVHMTVRLTGAVFVAFAAKLAFSRQMSATGSEAVIDDVALDVRNRP